MITFKEVNGRIVAYRNISSFSDEKIDEILNNWTKYFYSETELQKFVDKNLEVSTDWIMWTRQLDSGGRTNNAK